MSVASRIGDGWVQRAAWYIQHGLDRAQFVQSMTPYQGGEDYRTFNRIWQLGLDAVAAANRLDASGPGSRAPTTGIPGSRPGHMGYRYVVIGIWEASGGAGTQYRTVQVDSPFQLGYQDIFDRLAGLTPPQQVLALNVSFPPTEIAEWRLTGVDIQSAVRQ